MKPMPFNLSPKLKLAACTLIICTSLSCTAQTNIRQHLIYSGHQKMNVSFVVTPSNKEFKAGVTSLDSACAKMRIWIHNAEKKKCTISIGGDEGKFWSTDFTDSYHNRVYDLTGLDDGLYTISISNGSETLKWKVLVESTTSITRKVSIH